MPKPYTTLVGKAVRHAARLRGGGSALPGLIVEKIDPKFVGDVLSTLPRGVVVVSGTNGKTTTTKIVVELLESQGLKVFTNRTGSNFVRGVAAALLGAVDRSGQLDADIAVLELDEAHAVHFVDSIKPRYSLLLNVMRDQLDRFGEIDTTARLLQKIAEATTDTVVLNRDDPRLGTAAFIDSLTEQTIRSYGTHPDLQAQFPSDDALHSTKTGRDRRVATLYANDTSLESLKNDAAVIVWDGIDHAVTLQLSGVYNVLNTAAAIALTRAIMGDDLDVSAMLTALKNVRPAFGRGETVQINGQPCELILVKNPSGFRLALQSFDPSKAATMIAINDNYADGRDMSWLWDVDFSSLQPGGVVAVSGVRAYDMALRLQYDDVAIKTIEPDLALALEEFLRQNGDGPRRIFCTYTAMLSLRKLLAKHGHLEEVSV